LAIVLAILLLEKFLARLCSFSNDGPLAQQNAAYLQLPGAFTGCWDDLKWHWDQFRGISPSITAGIRWILDPFGLGAVGFSKFSSPSALFILGLGAWTFFWQSKNRRCASALAARRDVELQLFSTQPKPSMNNAMGWKIFEKPTAPNQGNQESINACRDTWEKCPELIPNAIKSSQQP